MKLHPKTPIPLQGFIVAVALAAASQLATANPYAGAVTNDNGTVRFIMNEDGATVDVVFEDNTTNSMGVLPKGPASFALGAHTSYQIICAKLGTGVPFLISSDTFTNSVWNSPRGVAVNQNARIGYLFGRIYAGNSANGGTGDNWKGHGLYAFNPDQTEALGKGTNATATATFAASGGDGPWRMRVAPDNTLLVDDWSTPSAALWQFQPDLSDSNLVLAIIGQTAATTAGIHGDMFGTPHMSGSLAEGNLVVWTADSGMPAPATATLGPNTSAGDYNCLFRYDIGAGPLPWNHPPDYAYTMGLSGISELRTEVEIGKDGKVMAGFGRANLSNGNVQILDPTGANVLYDSLHGSDPWNGVNGAGAAVGTYAGIRVSPDGRYLASVDLQNGITLATLTNGIPDEGTIFGIKNAPNVGNSRGMDWDAAGNIYVVSSGQGRMRIYSLGNSSTCVTSNDWTGTNGTFALILPDINASVDITQPLASQNYTNNPSGSAGAPIPGVFTISLNKHHLDNPVTVNFTRSGTASYPSNYTMLNFTNAQGIVFAANSVTFPAGDYPGGAGSWSADLQIIPTAQPVSGPTLTVGIKVAGGPNYTIGAPASGTIAIANTGPQLLVLTAAGSGTTMYRGVPNDYAKFVITRWGDTNGPNNSPSSINPLPYTLTNVTYFGTAVYPLDYTAQAQEFVSGQPPQDGSSAITINPGNVGVTCLVGNPVAHTDLTLPPTNVTIVLNLTNAAAPPANTNLLSQEGYPYQVNTTTVTLNEIDNAHGPESVPFWASPMTNAADSVNWTLTFATTIWGTNTVLPVVIPNYDNSPGTNDFDVRFGYPVANDSVAPSPTMAANGWDSALRVTVNKNGTTAPAGVNLYPQGQKFQGNYALRFDMYLSLYSSAINNQYIGAAYPREFALFGINHYGTNCNWRTTTMPAVPVGTGSGTTNADGVWFAIDAGYGSISPADFDAFTCPALPNSGITADYVSANSASQAGIFKHPPFDIINPNNAGGQPVNKWVNVSVEVTGQTNCTLYMENSKIFSFIVTNVPSSTTEAGMYTNGTVMLGYLDPSSEVSDQTAFAYFSNVRVLELSPYIQAQPHSLIVTQGADVSFSSEANLATAPITNTWYLGNTTPVVPLQTDTANATNLASTLSLTNVQSGTNYMAVFSDAAGAISSWIANLEVIAGPNDISTNAGVTVQFKVTPTGRSAPTAYRWRKNGTPLANNTHYAGVTTATLTITNVQIADIGTFSCAVTNAAGYVIPEATLNVSSAPVSIVVTPASQTQLWGSSASFTVTANGTTPFTYQWKKGGVDLADGSNVSGATGSVLTLSDLTTADAASYTAAVTNSLGGGISSPGVLNVFTPAPTLSNVSIGGGNVVLSFSSTNTFDTTNAFILQSSPIVQGPYTNNPGTFTTSGGTFQVTVPYTGGNMFYRLQHAN